MTVLDDLSGFEFEELMVDVFRHQGYENVQQAVRTADEGRDVTMVDPRSTPPVGVVVECKHTDTVGRPVVQKLHSAVSTWRFDGPKRGMVATTGRFTGPATEYAQRVSDDPGDVTIELLDGKRLREIGERIGMDLYSGRIEILCAETLRPPTSIDGVHARLQRVIADVENLSPDRLPRPALTLSFVPVVVTETEIDAVFETSVGVIHRIHETDTSVVIADRNGPAMANAAVERLVRNHRRNRVVIDELRFDDAFETIDVGRFGRTKREYRDWLTERQRDRYERTVVYTGDNNVTYDRRCRPNQSDVRIRGIDPVFVPYVETESVLGAYQYQFDYFAAAGDVSVVGDDFYRCVHCGHGDDSVTFCENCGSINCPDHRRTERLVDEPVCTGCSVTGEFFFSTKHFYTETNRETFRETYAEMPIHRKAMENPPVAAAIGLVVLVVLLIAIGGFFAAI